MRQVPEHFYNQSAVIPYRWADGTLEVLMITSRKKKRWVIPKGVKEPGLAPAESAAREALEEAGIRGKLPAYPIGEYHYNKWGGTCTVRVYVMEVEQMLPEWAESHRAREWVSVDEAVRRAEERDLKGLIRSLQGFVSAQGNNDFGRC